MNPFLVLRSCPDFGGPSYPIASGRLILGRSTQCDLVVSHRTISRQHAELTPRSDGIAVRDLGSRNGTFVDGQRVQATDVKKGQRLRFGQVAFLLVDPEEKVDEPNSELDTADGNDRPEPNQLGPANELLSGAQLRVLVLLLEGLSEKLIARELRLSKCTVHNHVQAIYRTLGVHSRSELLAQFLIMDRKLDAPAIQWKR